MTEPVRDLAHLSHVELLTPKPDESLSYFREILGMEIAGSNGDSVFLRGFGDYERSSLKLTAAEQAGSDMLPTARTASKLGAPGRGTRAAASGARGSKATWSRSAHSFSIRTATAWSL
jgi:catechol 2,3-dioxygenase